VAPCGYGVGAVIACRRADQVVAFVMGGFKEGDPLESPDRRVEASLVKRSDGVMVGSRSVLSPKKRYGEGEASCTRRTSLEKDRQRGSTADSAFDRRGRSIDGIHEAVADVEDLLS